MNNEKFNLLDRLKYEFNTGNNVKRLILINAIVFLSLVLIRVVSGLFKLPNLYRIIENGVALPGQFIDVLFQPWSIFTNIFVHLDFSHFIWNMIMLYLIGRLFITMFSGQRLVSTYILGGIFGAFLHIVAYQFFPVFADVIPRGIVGASGAIYAIMGAILYYRPNTIISLPFGISFQFWILAALFLLGDIIALDQVTEVAHFAHIGGAIFGVISVINIADSKQFVNRITRWGANFKMKNVFNKRNKFKVYKNEDIKSMTDDDYREHKKANQDKVNAILEKIGNGGYDSLTKAEKEFLFKFGNDL